VKRTIAAAVFVLLSGNAKANDVPFFSTGNVPDYVASMTVWESGGEPETHPRFVLHHRGWTRVEEVKGDDRVIFYGHLSDNAVLRTVKSGGDDFTWVRILKVVPSQDRFGIVATKQTEDSDDPAGEPCKWWQIVRRVDQELSSPPSWLSCLNRDGIEVGAKALLPDGTPSREVRLQKLERKSVASSDVRPPAKLFDPEFWLKPLRDYPDRPASAVDFEVRMTGAQSELRLLRHYPWRLEERRGKDGSVWFRVRNEREDQGIEIYLTKDAQRLDAARLAFDPTLPLHQFQDSRGQVDLKRSDRHLGEACAWSEMILYVSNAGRTECLTPDGVPLKIAMTSSWAPPEDYAAVRVTRRVVDLKEMFPPAELLDASKWGWPAEE
jgi:hypothetical protein